MGKCSWFQTNLCLVISFSQCYEESNLTSFSLFQNQVHTIRLKMKSLLSQGIEAETPNPNSSSTSSSGGATILTEERIEQLNSLGFNWDCADNSRVRLSWDHRFTELCEYFQLNGHWPPRTAGTIGEWAHKQKTKEVKRDKVFMEKYYAKLDSIGFPWRGECTFVVYLLVFVS